ncbi:AGAP006000-PA-like protein [Anopheles sinensis]|uniref:AGAP006000-PA-like protein n=1 Tax=Anopheles sinensis TaxID=74873 RepID=A0A084W0T8_ANOSI|nr:AGAP006000-PA-like protein [Anopheles sinensis]
MKFALLFVALCVAATMAVPVPDSDAQVLKFDSVVNPESYNYAYETSNGIQAQEAGELKNLGDVPGLSVRGSYTYTGPDGQVYTVTYLADENGFQPDGAHIPSTA